MSVALYTTGGNGQVTTALISADSPDIAKVTATAGLKSQSILITFSGSEDPDDVIVGGIELTTPDNTIIANGYSSTTIQALVTDTHGDPMPIGTIVDFETTLGTLSTETATITGDNGIVVISIISDSNPGTAVVTARSQDVSQTIEILFYNQTLVGSIALGADPETIPADGNSSTKITATVKGTDGKPVPVGTLVEFEALNGALGTTISERSLSHYRCNRNCGNVINAGTTSGIETVSATV